MDKVRDVHYNDFLSIESDQQGQNTRDRTVFLTLIKILDLFVYFFHQVCKKDYSYPDVLTLLF